MQTELIYNPHAGQVFLKHELQDVAALLRRHGWKVSIQETVKPQAATEMARLAARKGAGAVIAAGGDGTVSEVANGLVGTDTALGVLPLGTTNVWASQIGMPTFDPVFPNARMVKLIGDIEERIAVPPHTGPYRKVLLDAAIALVEGRIASVDVGEVSGHYFLLWAGIGLDAAIIGNVSAKEKRAAGTWAFLLPALGTAYRYPSTAVRLEMDGRVIEASTPLIVVSNIPLYAGKAEVGVRAHVNDGKLDVCVFKGDTLFDSVQHALKAISRRGDNRVDYCQAAEIKVSSARPLPVHLDGDTHTETPLAIRAVPAALRVIVPQNGPRHIFG